MRNQIQILFPWFIVKDKRVSRFVLIPQKICFMIFSLPASKINLFSLPFHTFWSVFFLYLKPFSPLPFFPFFVLFFDISPLTYKRTLFRRQYTVCTKISQKFFLLKVFSLIYAYKSIKLGSASQTVTLFCLDKQTIKKEPGKQHSGFYCLPSSSRFFAESNSPTNVSKAYDCTPLPITQSVFTAWTNMDFNPFSSKHYRVLLIKYPSACNQQSLSVILRFYHRIL